MDFLLSHKCKRRKTQVYFCFINFFSPCTKNEKKQFYFRFFLFLILYKKRKEQFYFRFSVFSFLYKKRRKAILLPFSRFSFVNKNTNKAIIVQIFTSGISCYIMRKWNERNGSGGGRNGDGWGARGVGGGVGDDREVSLQHRSTNTTTTTFLNNLKLKQWQQLRFHDKHLLIIDIR